MNIQKAIEILHDIEPAKTFYFLDNEKTALQLGIEALKRELEERETFSGDAIKLLPGETED